MSEDLASAVGSADPAGSAIGAEKTVAEALLHLWREQLETPGGRELLAGVLCRTMGTVLGEGCVKVCPMAGRHGQDAAMRKAVEELIVHLDFAREHADAVAARAASEPLSWGSPVTD